MRIGSRPTRFNPFRMRRMMTMRFSQQTKPEGLTHMWRTSPDTGKTLTIKPVSLVVEELHRSIHSGYIVLDGQLFALPLKKV